MTICSKIQSYKQLGEIPFQGSIDVTQDNKLKITPNPQKKSFYMIVNEDSINEESIKPIPLKVGDNPFSPRFDFQLKMGADIELHYKELKHNFKLDLEKEKQFYIDTDKEEIVFVDKESSKGSPPDQCDAWVMGAYPMSGCCLNDHSAHDVYGFVDCKGHLHTDHNCCHKLDHHDEL